MHKKSAYLKQLLLLIITLLSASCTTLYSGSEPKSIRYEERKIIEQTQLYLGQVPAIIEANQKENTLIYVYSFDGTNNDRNNINPKVERKTLVATLSDALAQNGHEVYYEEGPGNGDIIDSIVCNTCLTKAKEALTDLEKKLSNTNPKYKNIAIVVIGFSRGAAISRHFMNLVSKRWNVNDDLKTTSFSVRTYGILFDTVSTGATEKLNLGISASTNYLVHFVSKDENRRLFPVIRDDDISFHKKPDTPSFIKSNARLLELTLPGSHSDIGGSYKTGIGSLYHAYGIMVLNHYALIDRPSFEFHNDFYTSHDSRGKIDKLIDNISLFNNEKRNSIIVKSNPISNNRTYEVRRHSMNFVNTGSQVRLRGVHPPIIFDVLHSKDGLKISSPDKNIQHISYKIRNNLFTVKATYLGRWFVNSLDKKVLNCIQENQPSRIEIVTFESIKKRTVEIYCDKKIVDQF